MTCPTSQNAVIFDEILPPTDVFVRIPGHRTELLAKGVLGVALRRRMIGTTPIGYTIALRGGIELQVDAAAVRPAADLAVLFRLPEPRA